MPEIEFLPCVECNAPVNAEVHPEELGLCLECSDKFWSHDDE